MFGNQQNRQAAAAGESFTSNAEKRELKKYNAVTVSWQRPSVECIYMRRNPRYLGIGRLKSSSRRGR